MYGLDFMLQLYARNVNMWILSIFNCDKKRKHFCTHAKMDVSG